MSEFMPEELREVVNKVYRARKEWYANNYNPPEPKISIYVEQDLWVRIMQQAKGRIDPLFYEMYENRTLLGHSVHVVRMPDYRDQDKVKHGIKVFVGDGV